MLTSYLRVLVFYQLVFYTIDSLLLIYFDFNAGRYSSVGEIIYVFIICIFLCKSYKLPCRKATKKLMESTKKPHYRIMNKSKNVSCATIAKVSNEELCPF